VNLKLYLGSVVIFEVYGYVGTGDTDIVCLHIKLIVFVRGWAEALKTEAIFSFETLVSATNSHCVTTTIIVIFTAVRTSYLS
jgi:hypothetical protein